MSEMHLPIFVYGTLQTGEERSVRWPFVPQQIQPATIRGRLHDLGPYPALIDGSDQVRGELWHFRADQMDETLRVLDEIECFGNEDVDLYVRRVVDCRTQAGENQRAYVYFLADPSSARQKPIVPAGPDGCCHWRRRGDERLGLA